MVSRKRLKKEHYVVNQSTRFYKRLIFLLKEEGEERGGRTGRKVGKKEGKRKGKGGGQLFITNSVSFVIEVLV